MMAPSVRIGQGRENAKRSCAAIEMCDRLGCDPQQTEGLSGEMMTGPDADDDIRSPGRRLSSPKRGVLHETGPALGTQIGALTVSVQSGGNHVRNRRFPA